MIDIYNTPPVQTGVGQPAIEVQQVANNQNIPQVIDDSIVDPIVQELPDNIEQPIEQHASQENVDSTLRRPTRIRNQLFLVIACISTGVGLQHGAKNDPETFPKL